MRRITGKLGLTVTYVTVSIAIVEISEPTLKNVTTESASRGTTDKLDHYLLVRTRV